MNRMHETLIRQAGTGRAGWNGGARSRTGTGAAAVHPLQPLGEFGLNPGRLAGWCHVPAGLEPGAALVVVLHGCTQTAAGYDAGSGWSKLAEAQGFALLFPEQNRSNNANLCFNWFQAGDQARDRGEPASVLAMVGAMVERHGLDPAHVFVTGLSAGGAMAAVLLAVAPETFAAGAVVAGLPFGSAAGLGQALGAMRGQDLPAPAELAELVRARSGHGGPWPRLSVWHGSADSVVAPGNAGALAAQWRDLSGLTDAVPRVEAGDGHERWTWADAGGRTLVESWTVHGMGHGTPLAAGGADGLGRAGPHMLEAGLSSTREIARFFGLLDADAAERPGATGPRPGASGTGPGATWTGSADGSGSGAFGRAAPGSRPALGLGLGGIGKVIEDALRKAGLLS